MGRHRDHGDVDKSLDGDAHRKPSRRDSITEADTVAEDESLAEEKNNDKRIFARNHILLDLAGKGKETSETTTRPRSVELDKEPLPGIWKRPARDVVEG